MTEKPIESIAQITDLVKDIVALNYSVGDEDGRLMDELAEATEGLTTNPELIELLYKV